MSADTVISAFSGEHVARITGLSLRQLTYWDNTGFFKPSHATTGIKPLKIYSFNDIVGLRIISILLKKHKISIRRLKKVAKALDSYAKSPWSALKLMVCNGEVSFIDPGTGRGQGVFTGQYILMPIIDQIAHVQRAVAGLGLRNPNQIGSAERHRNVAHNAMVFAGTRVPIRSVERFLSAGYTIPAILEEYPSLKKEDIEAVKYSSLHAAA